MRRREFVTLAGGAAAAWPLAAGAQQAGMPVVGFLHVQSSDGFVDMLAAFREGLKQLGFVEGQNVAIEYRSANDQYDRLPELAADLVRRRVAVVATTSTPAALAAKAATTTIPIVFSGGADPVQLGLVASLNRPGGNVTGFSSLVGELGGKQLGILHELLPRASRFAIIVNSNAANAQNTINAAQAAAAAAIGRQIEVLTASINREIDAAFASLEQKRIDALLVSPNGLFLNRHVQLATLGVRHAVPAIYSFREFVEVGGLMSYGSSLADASRQMGIYTGRILKGDKPADLPVMRANKFEFVINLQTARTLGIEVPPTLLALADEVIE